MFKKSKSSKNIFILYLSIQIIIAAILYPLLPILLNYPPDSIDNNFQSELGELHYTIQYILLVFAIILINSVLLFLKLRKIQIYMEELKSKPSIKLVNKVKYLCIYTPSIIYSLEIAVPMFLLPALFALLSALPMAILKICMVYVSFFMLCAIISLVFSKKEFKKTLIELQKTYPDLTNNYYMPNSKFFKGSLSFSLMQQLLPLIFVIIVLISLIAYIQSSKNLGSMLYQHYKQYINSFLDDQDQHFTYSELKRSLNNIELLDDSHVPFIIENNSNYITSNNSNLSKFFVKYAIDKSESQDGRCYDYYCVSAEGYCKKVITLDGKEYYIGVYYTTDSTSLLCFLVITGVFFFVLSLVILIYIIATLSKDIKRVSTSLENIVADNTYSLKLPLTSNDEIKDLVIAFNEIQDMTLKNIEKIKSNQDQLMEKERLASLGQMIGGIAHNLKTPIMSIAGAAEGLTDLTKEYDISIGDPTVTNDDHHAIVKDMNTWIEKIKTHTSYMSDVITAVKGQAVAFSETANSGFTVSELLKYVDVLMKHELKNALVELKTSVLVPDSLTIKGNINSLVQVINNIISNAIQAYNGQPNKTIDFIIKKKGNNIVFTIQDYGCGMPKKIQDKLFKEMITTKGKNGTGLGLFMSYSNIRAHFNGNMDFKSEEGKGTRFDIIIPLQ